MSKLPSHLHCTGGITPKRVICGEVHLRGVALGQSQRGKERRNDGVPLSTLCPIRRAQKSNPDLPPR